MRAYRGRGAGPHRYVGNGRVAVGCGKVLQISRNLRVLRISGHPIQPCNWRGWTSRGLNKYISEIESGGERLFCLGSNPLGRRALC